MTEIIEQESETTPVPPPPPHKHRPSRVYQAAAWVAIVAGVVFIVGSIFVTGFVLGRHSGGGHGWQHRGHGEMSEMGPRVAPLMPWMRPDGPPPPPGSIGPGARPETRRSRPRRLRLNAPSPLRRKINSGPIMPARPWPARSDP